MSCLLIVSWVIEVEYTLTAIPQLEKTNKQHLFTYKQKMNSERWQTSIQPWQNSNTVKTHIWFLHHHFISPSTWFKCCSGSEIPTVSCNSVSHLEDELGTIFFLISFREKEIPFRNRIHTRFIRKKKNLHQTVFILKNFG